MPDMAAAGQVVKMAAQRGRPPLVVHYVIVARAG